MFDNLTIGPGVVYPVDPGNPGHSLYGIWNMPLTLVTP